MDVTLVTEGTYPYVHGGVSVWCDQMIRGLNRHGFHVVALTATGRETPAYDFPRNVASFHTVPIWNYRKPVRSREQRVRFIPFGRAARARRAAAVSDDQASDGPVPAGAAAAISLLRAALAPNPAAVADFEAALFELFLRAQQEDLVRILRGDAVALALGLIWQDYVGAQGPALRLSEAMAALDLIEHALRPLSFAPPRADLTHAVSNGLAALVGLTAKWLHGTPIVLAEHGVYLRERYLALRAEQLSWPVKVIVAGFTRRLCEAGYRAADLITPCNEYNQRWERRLGADPAKLRTVYNGVDPERFPGADDEPAEPTLVFVGRIDPLKDVLTLLRAFALVRERIPTARLRLFGAAPTGGERYRDACLDLAERLELAGAVAFEGQCSNVREAYAAGQVVVLSSISEGLPFTVLEAMACGRPNVGTEVGGVGEAIGETGIVVPPRRPAELAEACVTLLTQHERRRALGKAARERALELFTIGRAVEAFEGIYAEAAALAGPSPAASSASSASTTSSAALRPALLTAAGECL
jgi:polysaccharide biosynthesis protein PelF